MNHAVIPVRRVTTIIKDTKANAKWQHIFSHASIPNSLFQILSFPKVSSVRGSSRAFEDTVF